MIGETGLKGSPVATLWRSIGAKLFIVLLASLLLIGGLVGYFSFTAHRHDLEEITVLIGGRVGEVIRRSTSYHMMHNDREAMHEILRALSDEPGVQSVRIMDRQGRVRYSTEPEDIDVQLDIRSPVCASCHAGSNEVSLSQETRFRVFKHGDERVLSIVSPIMNTPGCASGDCHAHPTEHNLLGVLETNVSLAGADARLEQGARTLLSYSLAGLLVIILISALFVWRFVQVPVAALKKGTEKLAKGELGYQIDWRSQDELGDLAISFNGMSRQIQEARREITRWNETLEERVEVKTAELGQAHDQMMQAEKMASLGKMAAVVAHEINNPLSAILTYTKLIRRWIQSAPVVPARKDEMCESLQLIESESRRCGELVKNLLSFARASHVNMQQVQPNEIVRTCIQLVRYRLELGNINLQLDLGDVPEIYADGGQVEQLLLAMIMNAIDAMLHGGNLFIGTASVVDGAAVRIVIRDDGVGIPEEVLSRLFEPFVTTKESGKGVGLGLAISKTIVERHGGRIDVDSAVGRGTAFTITLPALGKPKERAGDQDEIQMSGVST